MGFASASWARSAQNGWYPLATVQLFNVLDGLGAARVDVVSQVLDVNPAGGFLARLDTGDWKQELAGKHLAQQLLRR